VVDESVNHIQFMCGMNNKFLITQGLVKIMTTTNLIAIKKRINKFSDMQQSDLYNFQYLETMFVNNNISIQATLIQRYNFREELLAEQAGGR
jgi:hypothetical protein